MPRRQAEPTVDDLNAQAPTGAAQLETRSPIGVPSDYVAQAVVPNAPGVFAVSPAGLSSSVQPVKPLYFDGDEWKPANFSPTQIAQLQKGLIGAGLIDKKATIRVGVWDEVSRGAYRSLLEYANGTGLKWGQALMQYATANKGATTGGEPPLQTRLSNPDDLKTAFRKTIVAELGQAWGDDKIDAMVAAYQAQERQAQMQAQSGGTVVDLPSAQTFAEGQVQAQDPAGAEAHDALGYETQFFDMLKGVV